MKLKRFEITKISTEFSRVLGKNFVIVKRYFGLFSIPMAAAYSILLMFL